MKIILVLLSLAAVANALCPGTTPCSGHGNCVADDKCNCYRDYQGIDCNSRRCPHTISWTNEHTYEECGGKGVCDTKTGKCQCFDGFSGRGCARMDCPNDCNGRGTCELLNRIHTSYTGWDGDKIQKCKCDSGYEGPSCERRICPKGNDPITAYDSAGNAEVDDVVTFSWDRTSADAGGQILIQYADHTGATYQTFPISTESATAITIEEALESIPNRAIRDVACTDNDTPGAFVVTCTFSDNLMGGNQKDRLSVLSAGCDKHGCQPVYVGEGTAVPVLASSTAGTTENVECSNRGTCDTQTGSCQCVDGYRGEACETQSVMT
jgi:hypothetical protein